MKGRIFTEGKGQRKGAGEPLVVIRGRIKGLMGALGRWETRKWIIDAPFQVRPEHRDFSSKLLAFRGYSLVILAKAAFCVCVCEKYL